jgi:TP901 family phage tail tape measure protein
MNIGTLIATIGGDITPLKGALGKANEALNKFSDQAEKNAEALKQQFRGLDSIGNGLATAGKKMSMFLTLPLLGAAAAAGKMAMSWEEGMAKINTTAQLPKEGLKALSDQIYKLGAEAGADLSTVPEAYEKIISQIGDAARSTEIFAASLKGAKAGFTDVSVVSGALAQSLSAIGDSNTSAQEVIDTLFAAKRVGAGEFADFANYIPSLIASAKGVGVSWKEVAGSFAYMTGKGNDAAASTMLLQNAFNALGKSDITNGLKSAGIAVFDNAGKMRGLSDIFTEVGDKMNGMSDQSKSAWLESIGLRDQQAKQAFMVLSSETDKLKLAMDATANATGELETALGMAANPAQNMAQVMTNLKGVAIGFGLVMMPAINSMISGLSSLLGWFVGLSDATKKWIVGIGAVVAAIGPLIFIVGKVILAIKGIKIALDFLAKNPFMIWISAIVLVSGLLIALWKNCETFRAVVKYVALSVSAFFQKAWIEIKMGAELMWLGIKTYFTAIPKLATAVWNIIKRVMKGEAIGDVIKDEFSKIFEGIKDEASGIKEKYNAELAAIKTPNYQEILDKEKAVSAAKEAGEATRKQLEESFTATSSGTGGTGTGKKSASRENITAMTSKSITPLAGGLNLGIADAVGLETEKLKVKSADMVKAATAMKNEVTGVLLDIGPLITDSLNSAFVSVGEGLGAIFAGTANAGDLFKNLLGMVADFCASLGKSLIAAGIGAIAFQKLLKTPWLAVAAGVALVALASFAKAKLSAGPAGGGENEGAGISAGKLSSVPAYASGGIVSGNSFSGDSVLSRLNSGEMVLNQSQQKNLFNKLDSSSGNSGYPSEILLRVQNGELQAVLQLIEKRDRNLR